MFVREKNNKSGLISVQVIDKSRGKYRVCKTMGSSPVLEEVECLYNEGIARIKRHIGQYVIAKKTVQMLAFVFFILSLQTRIYVILNHNQMNKKSLHPEWALACKRKGTELRLLKGKYYLYEVTSKWNPQKKRSVKITGKFLGRITEAEGFVESKKPDYAVSKSRLSAYR